LFENGIAMGMFGLEPEEVPGVLWSCSDVAEDSALRGYDAVLL
jgi:hypothetical protein